MSKSSSSKGWPTIPMIIVGLAIMFAGMYVYTNVKLPFQETLAEQGLPLNLGKTIAYVGVFLILFKVIEMFFIKPLGDAIEHRQTELVSTFTEAETLRAEMGKMKSDYEARLTETETRAREQIQAQIKEAQELKKSLMADAQRQADEYKQRAIAEIDGERKRVLTDLRLEVTKLSLAATEKLLGENVDTDRNRKLVDDFLATVEVKN